MTPCEESQILQQAFCDALQTAKTGLMVSSEVVGEVCPSVISEGRSAEDRKLAQCCGGAKEIVYGLFNALVKVSPETAKELAKMLTEATP